ncbi:MAG TPA: ParB/RepB/Spo0J family partition protein [Clostridiaceae bacterium]|nr:ParB/RepB/Spo0J family partition protein [Clostridiaceae bacterium]
MTAERRDMPVKTKRGLGRGLEALFESEEGLGRDAAQVSEIEINLLEPNRDQPRQDFDQEALSELAESIRNEGIVTPLIVTPAAKAGRYMIVAGERRWRAARMAGLSDLPVIIRDLTKDEIQRQALIDNVVRQDLNAMEEAEAYSRLIKEYGLTQDGLAAVLGKSRPAIANTLRLLNLPQEARTLVREGSLSAGHARAILALSGAAMQNRAAKEILVKKLSVREAEKLVRRMNEEPTGKKQVDEQLLLHVRETEDRLRRSLGAQVTLEGQGDKGKIVIRYHSADELERLIELLSS